MKRCVIVHLVQMTDDDELGCYNIHNVDFLNKLNNVIYTFGTCVL